MKIDSDIKQILDLQNVNEYDKARMYEQALRKYLLAIDQKTGETKQPQVLTESVSTSPKYETEIKNEKITRLENRMLETIPKTLRRKGEMLLNHLKETSNLHWNELGEIILDGEQIIGSNISDLLNDTLRPRKTGDVPRGWDVFASELKRTNVPRDLIGNKKRYEQSLKGEKLEADTQSLTKKVNSKTSPTTRLAWKPW